MNDLIGEMVAKGMSVAAIEKVATMIAELRLVAEQRNAAAEQQRIAAERRERHAAKMRDWRARNTVTSRDGHVTSRDGHSVVPISKKERKKESKLRGRISPNWVPDDQDRAYARSRGLGDDQI